ncbi:hypothetical protein A2U01_0117682, partial [Trifolium medium]|nr:hypothetical protein [Trifolium medium]
EGGQEFNDVTFVDKGAQTVVVECHEGG